MSLPLRSRRNWISGWMVLVAVLVMGPGCSNRPENSPVVRKKFQEMDTLQGQVADLAVQMKQMGAEMTAMRKDVGDVRSLSGGGEAVSRIEQIDTRMLSIEQELGRLTEAMNAGAKSRQVASASSSSPSPSVSSPAPASSSASSAPSSTPNRPRTVAATASTLPVRQVASAETSRPRGKYYTIQAGDSTASIAKSHGIDVEALMRANRLPKDATIFPGQKLYVPSN